METVNVPISSEVLSILTDIKLDFNLSNVSDVIALFYIADCLGIDFKDCCEFKEEFLLISNCEV